MSTSDKEFGTKVYPGWVWTLPNMAFDVPAIVVTVTDENGVESEILVSIRDYLTMPQASVDSFKNREIKPLKKGTHSSVVFDSDLDDIVAFKSMLEQNMLVDGHQDFTLDTDNVFYSNPISKHILLMQESPLNKVVVDETTI